MCPFWKKIKIKMKKKNSISFPSSQYGITLQTFFRPHNRYVQNYIAFYVFAHILSLFLLLLLVILSLSFRNHIHWCWLSLWSSNTSAHVRTHMDKHKGSMHLLMSCSAIILVTVSLHLLVLRWVNLNIAKLMFFKSTPHT